MKNGYARVYMRRVSTNKREDVYVHRIIAKLFVENPENKPFVNHLDCNRANNKASNLEWVTSKENEDFRDFNSEYNYKLFNKKFSDNEVIQICEAMNKNYSYLEICCYILQIPYTGIVHKRLSDIQRGITYSYITRDIFGFGIQRLSQGIKQ